MKPHTGRAPETFFVIQHSCTPLMPACNTRRPHVECCLEINRLHAGTAGDAPCSLLLDGNQASDPRHLHHRRIMHNPQGRRWPTNIIVATVVAYVPGSVNLDTLPHAVDVQQDTRISNAPSPEMSCARHGTPL